MKDLVRCPCDCEPVDELISDQLGGFGFRVAVPVPVISSGGLNDAAAVHCRELRAGCSRGREPCECGDAAAHQRASGIWVLVDGHVEVRADREGRRGRGTCVFDAAPDPVELRSDGEIDTLGVARGGCDRSRSGGGDVYRYLRRADIGKPADPAAGALVELYFVASEQALKRLGGPPRSSRRIAVCVRSG